MKRLEHAGGAAAMTCGPENFMGITRGFLGEDLGLDLIVLGE